jgi:hypothetical protein
MEALAGVGVLEQVGAVEVFRPCSSSGKWDGTQSRITPIPAWWRVSTRYMKSWGVP